MSPEEPNLSEPTDPTEPSGSPLGYEYSSDASAGANAPAGGDAGNETLPKRPLGLQRSDRSGRSPTTGGQPPTFSSGVRVSSVQADIEQLVRQALQDLERQRQGLQREVEQLERRKARLEAEMRGNFAGASQEIAIRVQGFKNYLVGSLQELVTAAEEMDLIPDRRPENRSDSRSENRSDNRFDDRLADGLPQSEDLNRAPLAAQRFAQQRDRINSLLDQYRTRPDYYGPPWQLRRTFEPIHAERTINWFFTQGGRGAVKSMGSRLQNVLVASAAISCLHAIYNQRLCVLVLATTPERLGEWRRWLQDCLGIARADFGTDRGVMLFEASEPMSQRAERLLDSGRVPFLIMDEAEDKVSLSLLQFPLWLGFAPDPANPSTDYDYY
jgi:hypothetical protein